MPGPQPISTRRAPACRPASSARSSKTAAGIGGPRAVVGLGDVVEDRAQAEAVGGRAHARIIAADDRDLPSPGEHGMPRRSHLRHERRAESRRSARTAARSLARRSGAVLPWRSPCCRPRGGGPDIPTERRTRQGGLHTHGQPSTADRGRGCDLRLPRGEPPPRRAPRDHRRLARRGGHAAAALPARRAAAGRRRCRTARASTSAGASATAATATPTSGIIFLTVARRGAGPHPRLPARGRRLHRQALPLPRAAGARQRPPGAARRPAARDDRGGAAGRSTSPRAARSCPASGCCCRPRSSSCSRRWRATRCACTPSPS